MTRRCATLIAALLLALGLTSCSETNGTDGEIVVTTNILGDVVSTIVGAAAPVRVLMKPNADPHSFGASAQEASAITTADLLVYNGLGLEEGVLRNVTAAAEQGVPTLAVGDHIDPIDYRDSDTAGAPDPHFWTDPQRMLTAVDVIVEAIRDNVGGVDMSAVDANADRYRSELQDLDAQMSDDLETIAPQRRKLVTNHHVLGYLAQRFGFTVIGAIVPSGTTLAAPSASDLDSLVTAVTQARVPAVFVDSSQPQRLAQVLADQAGLHVEIVSLYSESLSPPGTSGATYLDMMRANTAAIVTGLR